METTLTAYDVATIREGKVKRTDWPQHAFALIARRAGALVVECGWIVSSALGDDPESCSYRPFRHGLDLCWVGRRVVASSPEQALAVYADFIASLGDISAARPTAGDAIGNVAR